MTNQLRLILDDSSGGFNYTGGKWAVSTLTQWYSQTSYFAPFASNTVFASFSLKFEGTQIGFIGNTPTPNFSQFFRVTIDGGNSINMSYAGNLPPQAYVQWYQTPVLSDGMHTIQFDYLDGLSVDMAIITVGSHTSLANKIVFVDDLDSALQYSGSWVQDESSINSGNLPDALPVGTTTHRTSTVGDSVTFHFTGTSLAVYGVFSWTNVGLLAASFTLDGYIVVQSYPVNLDSPEHISASGEDINFLLFSNASIPAGDHTLVVNITEVDNITFILDYITYSPSFATLATMPDLNVASCSTSASSFSTCHSPTSEPSSSSTQIDQNILSFKTAPMRAIIAGAVGGSVALILLAVTLFYLWLRKQRKLEVHLEPFTPVIHGSHSAQIEEGPSIQQSNISTTTYNGFNPLLHLTRIVRFPFPSIGDFKQARSTLNPNHQASIGEPRSITSDELIFVADSSTSRNSQGRSGAMDEVDTSAESGPPAYES